MNAFEQWQQQQARANDEAAQSEPPATTTTEPAAAPSSGIARGRIVGFTFADHQSGQDVTTYGAIVEHTPAHEHTTTDDQGRAQVWDVAEQACVAWFTGGVSGPIDVAELALVE